MTDYYTQFSINVDLEDSPYAVWAYALFNDLVGVMHRENEPQMEETPRLLERLADEQIDYVGFEVELEQDADGHQFLWIHEEESADLDALAIYLQFVLQMLDSDRVIYCAWANYSYKPGIDAFGGGAFVVSKDRVEWLNVYQWIHEKMKEMAQDGS